MFAIDKDNDRSNSDAGNKTDPVSDRKSSPASNQAWQTLSMIAPIRPKLSVSQPGDAGEREADRVAESVMHTAKPARAELLSTSATSGSLQRMGDECEEEESELQRKATAGASTGKSAPPIVHDVLNSSGQALDAETRSSVEPHFGVDFSDVRVHADGRAADSAAAVGARAYTVDRNIVFGAGEYALDTSDD